MYKHLMKNILDVLLAFAAIIMVSPFLLLIAIVMKITEPGEKILFKQQRAGLRNREFTIYKFRTMTGKLYDENGEKLPDTKRVTKLGSFMRRKSIDELPQLFNILLGHMSMVGPRPLYKKYLAYYTETEMRRHEVKPGITGWAQVNGRNSLSWADKLTLDVWYVDNCSLSTDIKILFMTVSKLYKQEGINAESNLSMPAFKGSKANYGEIQTGSEKNGDEDRQPCR